MGTAAFFALLMALCDKRYSATQFALFTALDAVGRVFIGPLSGAVAESFGWDGYFLVSIAVGMPSLAILLFLRPTFDSLNPKPQPG
jgi:PAT family beta-lactamase induction signal transducer AmpG